MVVQPLVTHGHYWSAVALLRHHRRLRVFRYLRDASLLRKLVRSIASIQAPPVLQVVIRQAVVRVGFIMANKRKNGFSLIELLVVIAILGILMGILVVILNPAGLFGQGRDSRRLSDLATIQAALETYYAENNAYPAAGGVPFGAAWVPYLKNVPNDPSGSPVTYYYCVSGLNYEVCATMESTPLPSDCLSSAYGCSGNCCLTNPF